MRSNASSSGRNKRTANKPSVSPQTSTPGIPSINQSRSGTTPRPSPAAAAQHYAGSPQPGAAGRRSSGSSPSPANFPPSGQHQPMRSPMTQEPTDQPLPPSPRHSNTDTESLSGMPGPESHDLFDELRNQALHINQLNHRLTGQGRQLERADEQIIVLHAEIDRLRNLIEEMRITGVQPNVANREPCGMMTIRGRPCTKPKNSCVYRAAGSHPEQRQRRQSFDGHQHFDDEGMDQE
ncbi:unnamed protein product [Aphanomyces euteiches]